MQNLFAPPNSGVTFSYETPGDLQLPEFGGNAPEEDGSFLQVQASADDLVDGAEVIDFEYGVNGATPTTAGPTMNATNHRQALGSSLGVSARTLRSNLEFNRGVTTGNTPKLREFVLLYRKKPAFLNGYELDIDLRATANPGRSYAQVVADLETVIDSQTLVEFKEYGRDTTKYVEVPVGGFAFGDWIDAKSGHVAQGGREGMLNIRLEEVL